MLFIPGSDAQLRMRVQIQVLGLNPRRFWGRGLSALQALVGARMPFIAGSDAQLRVRVQIQVLEQAADEMVNMESRAQVGHQPRNDMPPACCRPIGCVQVTGGPQVFVLIECQPCSMPRPSHRNLASTLIVGCQALHKWGGALFRCGAVMTAAAQVISPF